MEAHPRPGARQRSLGQNFLVDRNILGVIERLAALSPQDVVLEVGGGAGVLSERLAARAAHLHVVELDRHLEEPLRARLAPCSNVSLHFADALAIDLAALRPQPSAMVANLPYGIAATLILRTVEELPGLQRWLVMVQREVGERLAASPGSSVYGVPSVLAQLSCSVKVLRAVPRTVFRPVPRVDSVLVGLSRHSAGAPEQVRRLVRDAFAHRRKALAGSLALARPGESAPELRSRVRAALAELGLPLDARAERLSPAQFVVLAASLQG